MSQISWQSGHLLSPDQAADSTDLIEPKYHNTGADGHPVICYSFKSIKFVWFSHRVRWTGKWYKQAVTVKPATLAKIPQVYSWHCGHFLTWAKSLRVWKKAQYRKSWKGDRLTLNENIFQIQEIVCMNIEIQNITTNHS